MKAHATTQCTVRRIAFAAGRAAISTLAATVCLIAAACQQPPRPIFDPAPSRLVWPPPPDAPRIRYVGQLIGEESLGARKSAGRGLRELLTGPIPMTTFVAPGAIAVDGDRVYVSDHQAAAVYQLDLAARTFKSIHAAGGKPLEWPIDVCLGDDLLAVCDSRRAAVFLLDMDGRTRATLGAGVLQRPAAVAFDSLKKQWWVVDAAAHGVFVFDASGSLARSFGSRGGESGAFNFPAGIVFDAERSAWIADSMNFRVVKIEGDSSELASSFGKKGDAAGDFALPRDVAIDSDGHLYVLDSQFENVQIFDRDGRLLLAFGEEGDAPGRFQLPSGMTIDAQDRIWIADTYNRRVQVFQYLREGAQ